MPTAPVQLADGPGSSLTSGLPWTPLRASAASTTARVLARFTPTTLAEMDGVSLLDRVDTKYVLSEETFAAILPSLASDYRVLEIGGRRVHRYRTLYFDTPDFALYRRHRAGRPVRRKVRSRTYLDTGLSFFEIKAKTATGRTLKHRLRTAAPLTSLTPEARAFLAEHLPADERSVAPKLSNEFSRITLVGNRRAERLTLDLGVRFDVDGRTAILPNVVIAELKRGGADHGSTFMERMRQGLLRPTGVSKYCVGVAMLVPGAEHDAPGEQLRATETVARGAVDARRAP